MKRCRISDPKYIRDERDRLFRLWQETELIKDDGEDFIAPGAFIYAHASKMYREYVDALSADIAEAEAEGRRIG